MNSSGPDFLTNGNDRSSSPLQYYHMPLLLVDIVLAASAAVANSLLLLTIYKDPHRCLRSPSTLLVANTALADLMAGSVSGSFLLAFNALLFINNPSYTNGLNISFTAFLYIAVMSITVSCCNVVAMAFDRYFAVIFAHSYREIVTAKRVRILIVLFWIYAAVFTSLLLTEIPTKVYEMFFCHLHVTLPLMVLPLVYGRTFHALGAHTQRAKNLRSGSEPTSLKTAQMEKKTTFAFVIVLCLFYVTFVPYVIAINLRNFCSMCLESKGFIVFLDISIRFGLMNSSLNPFVYAWRIPKYRRAVRTVLNSLYCLKSRNNAIDPSENTGTNLGENIGRETTNTIQGL